MQVIRGTPERGLKRMHVLTYLILGGFQRDVPRTLGRAIRGTPSTGVEILHVVSYAAAKEVFPEQSDEAFGERFPMASR